MNCYLPHRNELSENIFCAGKRETNSERREIHFVWVHHLTILSDSPGFLFHPALSTQPWERNKIQEDDVQQIGRTPAAEEYPLFITLYPSWELKGTEVSHEPLRHMKSWHELRKLDVWSARISSQSSPIQPVPEEELFAILTSQHPSSHHTSNPPKRSHRAAQAHNSTSLLALSGGPHPEPQTALHGGQRASRGKHPGQTTSETRTQCCRVSSACQGLCLNFTWTWDKAASRHWSSLDRRGAEKPSAARSAPACCRRPALGVPVATSPLTAALMSCRKHRLNI